MRILLLLVPAAVSLMLYSCGDGAPVTGSVSEEPDGAATTTMTARRNPTVPSIEQEVAVIRGLPAPADLPVSYVDRGQLRTDLAAQVAESYPPERVAAEEKVMKYLGLLDKNTDLLSEIEQALGEGVIGYYDDQTKQLKVVSDTEAITPLNEITLSHEITHAVQDQSFDLAKLTGEGGGSDSDRSLAVLSLIEGDATLVEQEYTIRVMSGTDVAGALLGSLGSLGSSSRVPPYLMHSLEFPYLSGSGFVNSLYAQHGWETVNAAYSNPPQSTEQVLHPEKYLSGEAPVPVQIPDLTEVAGFGWTELLDDSLGEFDVRELLHTELPASQARIAGAGWGGGAYRYLEKEGRPLLVAAFRWDTRPDADEFANAIGDCLAQRYRTAFNRESEVAGMSSPDGFWALAQQGTATVLVLAADEVIAEAAASATVSAV